MKRLKLTLCGALVAFGVAMAAVVFAPRPAAATTVCYDTYCSGSEDHCFYFAGYQCALNGQTGVCDSDTKCPNPS